MTRIFLILISLVFFSSSIEACQKCIDVLRYKRTKVKHLLHNLKKKQAPAPEEFFEYYYLCGQYTGLDLSIQKVKRYHKRHKKKKKH